MERSEEAVLDAADKAVLSTADILEFRADAFDGITERSRFTGLLKALREVIGDMPLLVTVRTLEEGGEKGFTADEYESVVAAALESGECDLIDIELKRASDRLLAKVREKAVPCLMSFHDFKRMPSYDEMAGLLKEMAGKGADAGKIAVMASSEEEADRLIAVSRQMSYELDIPIVTIAMGEKGFISRIAGERDGSLMTFASAGRTTAPGQSDVRTMRRLLNGVHRIRQAGRLFYITGFMGCGKSSAAYQLGRITGQIVCEMDKLIEEDAGMTIPEIFEKEGEEGFRKRETACLFEISRDKGSIVSCGGGIVTRPGNISLMKRSGDIIYLKASAETLCDRLKGEASGRPLLKEGDLKDRVESLMNERSALYESSADLTVLTDRLDPFTVALEIILMVENAYEVG